MIKEQKIPADSAELRRKAEKKLKETGAKAHLPIKEMDMMRLVSELQVHQIELEMQNEELRNVKDDLAVGLEMHTDLYDFAPVGYFTLDRLTNILHVNHTGASLLGMDQSRLLNARFAFFVSPENRSAFNAFLEGVYESQAKQVCEMVLLTESKAPIQVHISAMISKDGEEFRIAALDITERKRAEEALKEAVDLAQLYLDIAGVMLVSVARDQTITLINKKACKLLGYTQQELIGRNWFDISINEQERERVKDVFDKMIRGDIESVEFFENSIVTRNGEEHIISWHNVLLRDATGAIIGTLSSGEDITERKAVEEALRHTQAILKVAMDNSPVGIVIVDAPSGALRYVNYAGLLIRGNDRSNDVGNVEIDQYVTNWELKNFDGKPVESDEMPLARAIRFGETCSREFTIGRSIGDDQIVVSNASPILDDNGDIMAGIEVFTDITERKAAEAQLERTLEELQRSNNDLTQFAYAASHDMQEPLRMVTSYMQLLANRYKGKLDDKADKYIGYAVDGAMRMQELIKDLLEYSRVDTRGKPAQETDCTALLRMVIFNLSQIIDESDAKIVVGKLPTIMADDIQLGQVFQNLISNAIKFRGDAQPRVTINAKLNGADWEFCVADNGIGIDPQFHDRIFVMFQRLHERSIYPGTGIGLAITKKIVERHGGRIWIESEENAGSRFFFTIPMTTNKGGNEDG